MTSHYLTCIAAGQFERIFEDVGAAFGNTYARRHGKAGESNIGIILGEHFFFRTKSDAAVLIVLKELSPNDTRIEIISWAGGHGLLSVSYGAHADYVHDVRKFFVDSGYSIRDVEEIDYFDREKCEQLFREQT